MSNVILAVIMATAFVAIFMLYERDKISDYQVVMLGILFAGFGMLMYFKCGGWVCSFGL